METVKKFIKEHPHMWWGLYLPVYLTMFFIIEHLITDKDVYKRQLFTISMEGFPSL